MVALTTTINYIVDLINNSPQKFTNIIPAIEGSEDTDARMGKSSIIVYGDFDRQAELDTNKRIIKLPCSINVIINSSEYETAAESFNEAFIAAIECYHLIAENNRPTLLNSACAPETIHIQAQDVPFMILIKSAAGSSIQLAFIYDIKGV